MDGLADGRGLALIGELFIKSSAVLAAAILGAVGLRNRSSSLRHFWLSLCLVGLGFLPALSLFSAGWPAPWLPDRASRETAHQAGPTVAGGASPGMIAVRPGPETGMSAPALFPAGATNRGDGFSRYRKALGYVLPILWLAGLVLLLARLAAGLGRIRRITRESEFLDDPGWKRLLQRFISAVRLRRGVGLKAHPRVVVPLTWGFRRPVVIMPGGSGAWTDEARGSALFHELSHVKRGDFLVLLCVRLSLAVFWLNPLFWVAFRMLKSEQEKACDELVIKAGIRPSTYADNLLSFIRSVRPARSPLAAFPGVLGMFGRSQIRERLLAILGRKTVFKEVAMKTKVAVSVVAFLAVAFIGLARPERAAAVPGARSVSAGAATTPTLAVPQETQVKPGGTAAEKPNPGEAKPAETQKKEKKIRKEIKVVVDGQETGKEPVEITLIDGTARKEIKLDGSVLILKKGEGGKTVLVDREGKELAVVGGEGTRLEIKAGKMILLDSEKDLDRDDEPMAFSWVVKDKIEAAGDETEHIVIERADKADREVIVREKRVAGEPLVMVRVKDKQDELQRKLAETQHLLRQIEDKKLAESDLAAQRESLKELEKSLQALEEELKKKEEVLKDIEVEIEKLPGREFRTEADDRGAADREVMKKVVTARSTGDDFAIKVKIRPKTKPRETYEKAVAGLKKDLPAGFTLEPEFLEESGTMVLKISSAGGSPEDRDKVQKLVEKIQAEIK